MSTSTIKLRNVLKQQQAIGQKISQIITISDSNKFKTIHQKIIQCTIEIEAICAKNQLTPAALSKPSRKVYAWMKFLSHEDNFTLHLNAICRARAIAREIIKTNKTEVETVIVELTNFSGLYKYKITNKQATIQLSEGFIRAGDDVFQAVMTIVLLGKESSQQQIIRNFGLTEEYSDLIFELDSIAEVAAEIPQGSHYNLEELFENINREYFAGKMSKPRLTWNQTLTRRKFGHYERTRNRVVISKTLDSDRIPQFVVEFVLYHELLHKEIGVKYVNGRCLAHTAEFRRQERQFKFYLEASQYLGKIARQKS
ncbi:hypothetical protein STA3757_49820 (plasmid) [Stanieria sp. NIES-3757]|nr:hypothetical protein STA3757_49820 [Stanieria sp. NIES-3757]